MEQLKALDTVYSYMFPEVKQAIFNTMIGQGAYGSFFYSHHELLKHGKDNGAFAEHVLKLCRNEFNNNFLFHFLQSPEHMDVMHEPVFRKWVGTHKNTLPGIDRFENIYPTSGSEEGIREFMTYLLATGCQDVYVLEGEYEGYKFVGDTRRYRDYNVKVTEINVDMIGNVNPSWFFISNPSAIDGNLVPNSLIERICEAGHYVFMDLAYVDCTLPHNFDLTHKNIKVVVMSFSKPYGLFYFRFGGLLSKMEIPSLVGNKWFKVVPSILVADTIMDEIDPEMLMEKYKPIQQAIVSTIAKEHDLPLRCSDVVILAHINKREVDQIPDHLFPYIDKYRRAGGYRFCLKPYFEEWEASQDENKNGR
jgi:hypothetical protein